MLSSRQIARAGAVAAILGGIAWAVKGLAILLTGDQPPVLFALAPPLFALGLVGLYARIEEDGGRIAKAGLVLVGLSIFFGAIVLIAWAFARDALPRDEDEFVPLSLVVAGAAVSLLVGLVVLGVAARHASGLRPRWRAVPFAVGVLFVPGMIVGGILAALSERLLEIPLAAFALGWIAIGCLIWPPAEVQQPRPCGGHRSTRPVDRAR